MAKKSLKTACMVFVDISGRTAAQLASDTWTSFTVTSSTFLQGTGFQEYLNALRKRGHAESAWTLAGGTGATFPTVAFNNTNVIMDFCSLFDYCFLGNAPSVDLVRGIKNRSRRPEGTKVGIYFHNLTSIPHKGNRTTWWDTLDAIFPGSFLVGTNVVSGPDGRPANCTRVDQLELTGSGGCASACGVVDAGGGASTHTWLTDMGGLYANAPTLGLVVANFVNQRYLGEVEYFLIDNVNPSRQVGDATNYTGTAATTDANATTGYLAGIRNHLVVYDRSGKQMGLKIGRNGHGHGIRNDAMMTVGTPQFDITQDNQFRYQEHFIGTGGTPSGTPELWTNMQAYIEAAKRNRYVNFLEFTFCRQRSQSSNGTNFNNGTRLDSERWGYNYPTLTDSQAYAHGPGVIGGVDYGDWPRLRQEILKKGPDNNVIVCARSSSTFGMVWRPELGPVV